MLPDGQLLTVSTTFANYKTRDLSSTAKSIFASSFVFLQTGPSSATEKPGHMAHHQNGTRASSNVENELWFNLPSSARQPPEQCRAHEQSAYQATTKRVSTSSTSPSTTRPYSGVPSIATTVDTDKPLPPPPSHSERIRKSTGFRSMLSRPSSKNIDPSHLQPESYTSTQGYPATTNNLSIDTQAQYPNAYSRSMPNSPYEYYSCSSAPAPATMSRAHSSAADYSDFTQYQSYTPPLHLQPQPQSPLTLRQVRATSMNTYFDASQPRARTFPDTVTSPSMRGGVSSRPRPHTWLSPTDSFSDASQFSLFVQATTGLNESAPFSPNGPPQLQGSLFARTSGNDRIPLPFQNASAAVDEPRLAHSQTEWQNFEPPSFATQSVSASMHDTSRPESSPQPDGSFDMTAVNRELELLGLDDTRRLDEELPDYAQSQAEAHERRREEASARARELEARWRSTRTR
jgi:hypothetical protein